MADRAPSAIVTGAAQGIGQAIALRLASDGHDVVVADLRAADETVSLIEDRGGTAGSFELDVTDAEQVDRLARFTAERGEVKALINNAGIFPNEPFENMSFESWRRVMSINLDALFLVTHALRSQLCATGSGRVVNIASNAIGLVIPGYVHYAASKAGVVGFTRGLATELAEHGVTVNAVCPALTRSPFVLDPDRVGPGGMTSDEELELAAGMQAIHRSGEPRDVAGVVSFLASEDSEFMTGQTLVVDGGLWRV